MKHTRGRMNFLWELFLSDCCVRMSLHDFISMQYGKRCFFEYLESTNIQSIADITRSDINRYIEYLNHVEYGSHLTAQKKYRPNFVYRKLRALWKFFEFLTMYASKLSDEDIPKSGLLHREDFPAPNRRTAKHFPEWFDSYVHDAIMSCPTHEDISSDNTKKGGVLSLKTKTQIILLYHTGIRSIDLFYLERDCIFQKDNHLWIRIFASKVQREYEIPIVDELYAAIQHYKEVYAPILEIKTKNRVQRSAPKTHYLFPLTKGDSPTLARQKLYHKSKNFLSHVLRKAEAEGHDVSEVKAIGFGTHKFRHNMAIRLIRLGADPLMVAEFLGHKDLSMAQNYIIEDEAYIDDVMQEISDEGVLAPEDMQPSPEFWDEDTILLHNDVVKKVDTGWCTYVNGESPCGEEPYECWLCDRLKPKADDPEYQNFLVEQRKVHQRLYQRNVRMNFIKAAELEEKILHRIDEFLSEIAKTDSKTG